jgi:ATP-dependent helicase HrpB
VPSQLPIDDHLAEIVELVRRKRALVLSAPPGAGKTTRVPPALAVDGPTIVLQPRRLAARAIARRIADEQHWTLGDLVGWHVRFERRFSSNTRVLLATEGILTARLQQDPLLSDFRTVVLDEFHERSIHADFGLALTRQAWRARDDLRVVVMSATLETSPISSFLDDCPVLNVPGTPHPVVVEYRAEQSVALAVRDLYPDARGTLLCFLPGAPEIRRAETEVRQTLGEQVDVLPLHGSLPTDQQDRALAPSTAARVILATNIAETSLTVPGVTTVVDTGTQKVARYDPDRGLDTLHTERIARDSAEQRAGRAGRLGPGRVRRLWSPLDTLKAHRESEIHRVDLSDVVLAIVAWGGQVPSFEWFEAPDPSRIDRAVIVLTRLGALERGQLTPLGRRMSQLPLAPRLARILVEGRGDPHVALACAVLSERHVVRGAQASTTSDLLSAVDAPHTLPNSVVQLAGRLSSLIGDPGERTSGPRETQFRRATFAGYADRLARRRASGSNRFLFASGTGGVMGAESGVHEAEFIVALDASWSRRGEGSEALIRVASAVDPEWIEPTSVSVEHELDPASGRVRAVERSYYEQLPLRERDVAADPEEAARRLSHAYLAGERSTDDLQLIRRIRFAGLQRSFEDLVHRAAAGVDLMSKIRPASALDPNAERDLDRLAPETLLVPSGRRVKLEYREEGTVVASVKLQELFGLAESPQLGPFGQPVIFSLLAPNGRPVQTTRDLRNFWDTTYQSVRKELRGRYPRHPWPDDPWTARATARAKPKRAP